MTTKNTKNHAKTSTAKKRKSQGANATKSRGSTPALHIGKKAVVESSVPITAATVADEKLLLDHHQSDVALNTDTAGAAVPSEENAEHQGIQDNLQNPVSLQAEDVNEVEEIAVESSPKESLSEITETYDGEEPVAEDANKESLELAKPNIKQRVVTFAHNTYSFLPGSQNKRLRRAVAALVVALSLGAISSFAMLIKYGNQAVEMRHAVTQPYDAPVVIRFSRPVQKGITYKWAEPVEGTWETKKSLGGISQIIFTPQKDLAPGSRLVLQVASIAPALDILSDTKQIQSLVVNVESAAKLKSISPAQDAKDVGITSEVRVTLTARNRQLRKLCLEGDVPVKKPCLPDSNDDKTFMWALERPLDQTRKYTVTVVDRNQPADKKVLKTITFETVHEPQVTAPFAGYLHPGDTLELGFDQDMQTSADITFTMPGNGNWASPRRYVFKAGAVTPGQTYTYKVAAGAKSVAGGFIATDKIYTAATPGPIRVVAARPGGAKVPLDSSISFTFDQPVDRASAESAFSISPQVAGVFSWAGNTMTFKPNGLGYQTGYTASLAAGIKPVFGLPSTGFSLQFVTIYETKRLDVPYYRQAHSLSCEAASLRMALGYYGVGTSDDEILGRIGYAPQARDTATNTWQDPYQMFVGNVDGRIGVDGWGVYAGPVAAAARSFGRGAMAISGVSAEKVAAEIYAGHPVVLWGISGSRPVMDSWNTTTSGVVSVPRNAHVRTVYGVDGTADNPVGFYINDPISGRIYMSAGQMRANSAGNAGNAVIVY
jgi:uncharacterized protein YvpB